MTDTKIAIKNIKDIVLADIVDGQVLEWDETSSTFLPATPSTGSNTRLSAIRVYTSSDTWTKPANLDYIITKVQGSGAGGGGVQFDSAQGTAAGGGGEGGYTKKRITEATLGSTESITVGAAG